MTHSSIIEALKELSARPKDVAQLVVTVKDFTKTPKENGEVDVVLPCSNAVMPIPGVVKLLQTLAFVSGQFEQTEGTNLRSVEADVWFELPSAREGSYARSIKLSLSLLVMDDALPVLWDEVQEAVTAIEREEN